MVVVAPVQTPIIAMLIYRVTFEPLRRRKKALDIGTIMASMEAGPGTLCLLLKNTNVTTAQPEKKWEVAAGLGDAGRVGGVAFPRERVRGRAGTNDRIRERSGNAPVGE
ncbi:hypothetical protein Droror1_Dr00003604 [Drosera rotundifolia]